MMELLQTTRINPPEESSSNEEMVSWLTREQAYKYLGLGRYAFNHHIRPNVPRIKMGRRIMYRRIDLDDYIAKLVDAARSARGEL